MWSSPDFDSSSLSLVLRTKVKKVQHKRMVIKNSFVTKDQNVKQKSKRNRNSLVVATWNVRTLVECSGDERICRKQIMGIAKHGNHSGKPGKIDRKIDLLMENEEIWCICCRNPRDKVVWKGCVASG